MINLIKRFAFRIYLAFLNVRWLPVRKVNYKYGEWIITRLGRAKYKINGLKLFLNPLNMIDKQLIMNNGHDAIVNELLNEIDWKDSCFLDIGANWGLFSLIAAKSGAEVISFEPVARELQLLYDHVRINNFNKEITVFPIGLSDKIKEETIYLGPNRNTGTNSLLESKGNLKEERIFNRLDNILPASVIRKTRLVKIDVEGYELFVLEGMRNIMPYFINTRFVVEITPGFLLKLKKEPKDIYGFFQEFGFSPKYGLKEAIQYDEIFMKNG